MTDKKKIKDIRTAVIFKLSPECLAYIDSFFLKSYHYTIVSILERCKALNMPLELGVQMTNRQKKVGVHLSPELLLYIKSIQKGALAATVATMIDSARRLNLNPFPPLPAAPAQSESLPETNGENLPE